MYMILTFITISALLNQRVFFLLTHKVSFPPRVNDGTKSNKPNIFEVCHGQDYWMQQGWSFFWLQLYRARERRGRGSPQRRRTRQGAWDSWSYSRDDAEGTLCDPWRVISISEDKSWGVLILCAEDGHRTDSTAENAFKDKVNPSLGYLGRGFGDSPEGFYIYSSRWLCLLQAGWEMVASRCTPKRCSLSNPGSFEYSQDKRSIGISCLPTFGSKFDKCLDWKSETESEVFRAFWCQYHC